MTVPAVAERAGVSRATAYRYFLNNDAVLLWATRPLTPGEGFEDEDETHDLPTRAAGLVRRAGEWAFEHEPELRAVLALSLQPDGSQQDSSRTGRMQRDEWIRKLLTGLPDEVDEPARGRLAAALTALFGADALVWTRDAAQLSPEAALDTLAWMAHALVSATLADVSQGEQPAKF